MEHSEVSGADLWDGSAPCGQAGTQLPSLMLHLLLGHLDLHGQSWVVGISVLWPRGREGEHAWVTSSEAYTHRDGAHSFRSHASGKNIGA